MTIPPLPLMLVLIGRGPPCCTTVFLFFQPRQSRLFQVRHCQRPMMMSTRIDTLDPALLKIFLEPELIAVNQDYAGTKVQGLRRYFGPRLTSIFALHYIPRAVRHALLGGHAD